MNNQNRNVYLHSIELHGSIVTCMDEKNNDIIIALNNLRMHGFINETGNDKNIVYTDANLILSNCKLYGNEPEFPARIIDFSLVRDGNIFGNLLEYPFLINGEIQLVLTLEPHNKMTIRASKMFMIVPDPVNNDENLQ